MGIYCILDNLIANAKKYKPTGTKVKVEAQNTERGVMLTIVGKELGFPQDELNNLFGLLLSRDQYNRW